MITYTIDVYLDDGRVATYELLDAAKAREHSAAMVQTGLRFSDGNVLEHYPPHRITKIKITPAPDTAYLQTWRGT